MNIIPLPPPPFVKKKRGKYRQKTGTAIGSKLGMACTYMELLELSEDQTTHYLRYINNIWGVWNHVKKDFLNLLN